jgi:hypothetical protein
MSLERHTRQLEHGDPLRLSPAARHAGPVAEGRLIRPVVGKEMKRIGQLGFEGQQRGKVGVAAASSGDRWCCSHGQDQQQAAAEHYYHFWIVWMLHDLSHEMCKICLQYAPRSSIS